MPSLPTSNLVSRLSPHRAVFLRRTVYTCAPTTTICGRSIGAPPYWVKRSCSSLTFPISLSIAERPANQKIDPTYETFQRKICETGGFLFRERHCLSMTLSPKSGPGRDGNRKPNYRYSSIDVGNVSIYIPINRVKYIDTSYIER